MTSAPRHSEAAFETVIERHMLGHGYVAVPREGFDRGRALFPDVVLEFIRETQPREWAKLEALHGPRASEQVLVDLEKWLEVNGSLATLRHGFKCYGRTLQVAYFKAAHELNPELEERYAKNRLGITRQLHYSPRSEKSLDVTLSVNGIPVATLELKNPMTGQVARKAPGVPEPVRVPQPGDPVPGLGPGATLRVPASPDDQASAARERSGLPVR